LYSPLTPENNSFTWHVHPIPTDTHPLVTTYRPTYPLKWINTPAFYTDGSARPNPPHGTFTGATFYYTVTKQLLTVNPNGTRETNTITRAELVGIHSALEHSATFPTSPITIFTDSLTSLYNIQTALRSPHSLTEHKHAPLLLAIRSILTSILTHNTPILLQKVKSHSGILGNDLADAGANHALDNPTKCDITCSINSQYLSTLPAWPCLPPPSSDQQSPAPWFTADLTTSLKTHLTTSHPDITDGVTGNHSSLRYNRTQTLHLHCLPQYSYSFWNTNTPFSHKRNILKSRTNTIWTSSLAKSMKRPYKTRAGTITTGHCPLCSCPSDTPGHILGGCSHPQLKSYYIARHNKAVLLLQRAISTGPLGSCFQIMDATTEDNLPHGVYSSRIPTWMIPNLPPHFSPDFDRTKLRPDLLVIEGLAYTDFTRMHHSFSLTTESTQKHLRSTCVVHPLEVGYTSEYSLNSCIARKHDQHKLMIELLLFNNWQLPHVPSLNLPPPVLSRTADPQSHSPSSSAAPSPAPAPVPAPPVPAPLQLSTARLYIFILGSSGYIFKPADILLAKLKVPHAKIHTTLKSLASHATTYHQSILRLRRRLENTFSEFLTPIILPDPP